MGRFKNSSIIETIVIIIYFFLVSFVAHYHEPWFDEAQAWLIARDSNLFDMIWNVLRYEGHTPLWYICLYIPSHLGISYELGLKSVNIIFITLAVVLIVKKSPFPMYIRLLLPFTYFLFYQYGVISRSYSLLTFILFLTAVYFNSRNEKPFRFMILLALLGSITVHGILIAFGIALAWFIEIYSDYSTTLKKFSLVFMDTRFHSLILLGLINIIYVMILWPMPDKFTPLQNNAIEIKETIFRLFAAPLNSIMLDEWPYTSGDWTFSLYLAIPVGIALTIFFVIWALSKQTYLYILFPYTLISLFMAIVYFSKHHTGIYFIFLVFAIWISSKCVENNKKFLCIFSLRNTNTINIEKLNLIKALMIVCVSIIFSVQIFWAVSASVFDIELPYSNSRNVADFIKNNHLEGRKILNCINFKNEVSPFMVVDISAQPYFSENMFYNINLKNQNLCYITHRKYDYEDIQKYLNNIGKPDFIIARYAISNFSKIIDSNDYMQVEAFNGCYMWKNQINSDVCKAFIRKDLQSEFPKLGQFISID